MFAPIETLPDQSRVWIYQAEVPFSDAVAAELEQRARNFVQSWTAHDANLQASVAILHNQFLVVAVDEAYQGASGCSIDKMVKFITTAGEDYSISFFNRMRIAWREGEQIRSASFQEAGHLIKSGALPKEIPVFDNLVDTLGAFRSRWEVPLMQSWHREMLTR